MSNNVRVRPVGFWTFNSAVAPAEFELIDSQLAASISGTGGTYAPTSVVTIGGSGVDITGTFNAPAADSITVTNLLTVTNTGLLNLVGNQTVQSGATVQFIGGSFLTVSNGATLSVSAGATVTVAAAATLSGATTVSGALTCSSTFTISGSSNVAISPGRSYTRTCGGAIRYDSAKWQPPAALAAAPVTLAQAAAVTPGVYAEMVEYRADVPQSSTLFSVTVRVKGGALLAGLPATLPTVRVIRTDTTTGAAIVLATTTDTTVLLADYKLDHDIVASIAVSVDRTKYEYLVYVEGDSGSGGTFGTEVSSPRMIYIRGIIGEE